jgi:hypothetical protein
MDKKLESDYIIWVNIHSLYTEMSNLEFMVQNSKFESVLDIVLKKKEITKNEYEKRKTINHEQL